MRPWRMHLNIKKSARSNADYIELLKKIVAEQEKHDKKSDVDNEL